MATEFYYVSKEQPDVELTIDPVLKHDIVDDVHQVYNGYYTYDFKNSDLLSWGIREMKKRDAE